MRALVTARGNISIRSCVFSCQLWVALSLSLLLLDSLSSSSLCISGLPQVFQMCALMPKPCLVNVFWGSTIRRLQEGLEILSCLLKLLVTRGRQVASPGGAKSIQFWGVQVQM